MHTVQKKTNKLHLYLVKNFGKVRIKDQVYALMDLYEVAKSNLSRTEELLTTTLGTIGDDKVIPALVDIAKDPYINIGIRNRAVEILGKKETTEIVGAFTELLGDPNTNLEVREFALNTMKGVTEEKLILTLLDTYNVGKKQYFSLLNTLIDALGNFKDPKIRNALTEIALNNDYDLALRKKAINKLGESGDVSVIPTFLSLLNHSDNYNIYHEITTLVKTLGVTEKYQEEIRRLAFKAHLNSELYE
jgi:HEAT repeat protein